MRPIWVEAAEDVRLKPGLERDGESHRTLWLRWMAEERCFFAEDGTRARADLRVEGNSGVAYDPSTSVVLLDA